MMTLGQWQAYVASDDALADARLGEVPAHWRSIVEGHLISCRIMRWSNRLMAEPSIIRRREMLARIPEPLREGVKGHVSFLFSVRREKHRESNR